MSAIHWLVPLVLSLAGVAQAQDAQQTPPAPGQTPAEAAPLVATPAQPVAPAPLVLAPGPYVPPPPVPPGTIALPPYPGPAPYRFASAAEMTDYGTWRIEQLAARERSPSRA